MDVNVQIPDSSPIQRLPVELLTQIFLFVVLNPQCLAAYKRLRSLLLVSRRWNNIMESSPQLWCWLDTFSLRSYNTTAITKSRDLPLHIICGNSSNGYALMDSNSFWDLIAPQAHRWHDVYFIRCPWSMRPSTVKPFEPWLIPLPELRTFEWHANTPQLYTILKIEVHPRHKIMMGHLMFQTEAWNKTPLWSHIKSLDIAVGNGASEMTLSRFEKLMVLNPEMESLSLTMRSRFRAPTRDLSNPAPPSATKFNMPCLRTLNLSTSQERTVHILDRLEAPSLQSSWIELYFWPGEEALLQSPADGGVSLNQLFRGVRRCANGPVTLTLNVAASKVHFTCAGRRTTLEFKGRFSRTELIQRLLDGLQLQLLPEVVSTELTALHQHFFCAGVSDLMAQLPHVHSLIITRWQHTRDLAFLGPSFAGDIVEPSRTYGCVFPELRILSLPEEAGLKPILEMLVFRQSGQLSALEKLTLCQKVFKEGDLDQIRGSVGSCQLEIVG